MVIVKFHYETDSHTIIHLKENAIEKNLYLNFISLLLTFLKIVCYEKD